MHPIRIGCDGWRYPDWDGVFYPNGLNSAETLTYYADRFPALEIDSTFYRIPNRNTVRSWAELTPPDFAFALKAPRAITHEKRFVECEEEVDAFLRVLEELGPKLHIVLLQCGYFNRDAFDGLTAFLDRLDPFLADWPTDRVPLALEIRNPRWLVPEFTEVLRTHQTSLTLAEQDWMPHPAEVADQIDVVTGPLGLVRLLGHREEIEQITTTWDRIVLDRRESLARSTSVIQDLAAQVPVYVFASNHYAGHSPSTVAMLREMLGIPAPIPPERPPTTLFD